jgi:hypothetical protein
MVKKPTCLKILIYQHYKIEEQMPNWCSCTKWSRDWSQQYILIRLLNRIDQNVKSDPSNLDCVAQNIIDRQVTNNTRSFAVPVSKTNQYRNSFFVDTIVSWNKLPEDTARAKTVQCFKEASRPATNLAALSKMRLYQWWSCIVFI